MANYPEFELSNLQFCVYRQLCATTSVSLVPQNPTDRRRSQDGSASNEQRPIAGSVGDGTKALKSASRCPESDHPGRGLFCSAISRLRT